MAWEIRAILWRAREITKAALGTGGGSAMLLRGISSVGWVMADWVRAPKHGMVPRAQAVATTCWLNCYGMLYDWQGLDKTTIGPKLAAAGVDVAKAFNGGLDATDFMKSAVALGLRARGGGQSWSAFDLKTMLASSPVWIAGAWSPRSPHVVVLTGASERQVEIIDPWWQGEEAATETTRGLDSFVHGDGGQVRGTDFYLGRIGGAAYWA